VEDPSAQDAEADLTDLLVQAEQPDVAVDVNALSDAVAEAAPPPPSLPGLSGFDSRTETPSSPSLGAPAAPSAPRIASLPAPPPPRPQPSAEEATPEASPAEEAEVAEADTPESAPDEAENRPPAEEEAGAEEGEALLQATAPRARPRDFEQQLAEVAEAVRQAEADRVAEAARIAQEEEARRAEEARVAAADAERQAEEVAAAIQASAAIQGPPLTAGEVDGFKIAVGRCWRIPDGVENAADLTVVVSVEFGVDGRVVGGPTLIEPANNSSPEIRTAFESARRAILRCAGGGYDLPRDKYDQWKTLELVFEPSGILARF
ncbi:MAG: hypothetical protein AAF813_12640, partial [Pseudomonadota bacterium]